MEERKAGVIYATVSYLIWGFTPIYWQIFSGVDSMQILAHRMFWALFVSLAMLAVTGGLLQFKNGLLDRKRLGWSVLRALLIAGNWFTYVWAIGHGKILEASLGYYLNPLVSILCGLIFLQERLNKLQWAAVGFAVVGVTLKTILVGSFPLISVLLALQFGIYGLLKKKSTEGSLAGLAIECLLLLPVSLFYLIFVEVNGSGSFLAADGLMKLMYVTTGIITVVPLFMFSKGAMRIPLTWIGFLQFIAPTMMLLFGVFLYGEDLSVYELTGFAAVWIGIVLFLFSSRKS
ncbi:MAG: EamA family transporter RarD [Spirochaetales bacterium]|uniref:EamA family transporter RarD n=1 Tax=Candidatus Thalassospirochaeta sargassi TaxID=3119039 RepID=A0AAJ1MIK8_9SPIO|nr:EamA family transporter RarD [Spirochaetales bacterium]